MSCKHCEKAATGMWHGFASGCKGCDLRELIRSPMIAVDLKRVRLAGKLDGPYLNAIEAHGLTHAEIKAAAAVDHMEQAKLAAKA